MEKFRRLFNRAHLSQAEVAMLRGIFRQMDWGASPTTAVLTRQPLRTKK